MLACVCITELESKVGLLYVLACVCITELESKVGLHLVVVLWMWIEDMWLNMSDNIIEYVQVCRYVSVMIY